jgi:hypothetical protein
MKKKPPKYRLPPFPVDPKRAERFVADEDDLIITKGPRHERRSPETRDSNS